MNVTHEFTENKILEALKSVTDNEEYGKDKLDSEENKLRDTINC